MKPWMLAALAACSSSSPPASKYPELAPDPQASPDDQLVVEPVEPPPVAAGLPAWSPGLETTTGEQRQFSATGPACMPAGNYTVAWDLSAAQVTKVGTMGDGFCEKLALIIPEESMNTARLDFPGGHIAWVWAGASQVVITRAECDLQITSDPARARITFAAGVGTGTADYSISTGHAFEACHVRGAKLTVTATR